MFSKRDAHLLIRDAFFNFFQIAVDRPLKASAAEKREQHSRKQKRREQQRRRDVRILNPLIHKIKKQHAEIKERKDEKERGDEKKGDRKTEFPFPEFDIVTNAIEDPGNPLSPFNDTGYGKLQKRKKLIRKKRGFLFFSR